MMTEGNEKVKGTFYFPEELFKDLKHFSVDSGQRLNEVLTIATREGLKVLKERSTRRMKQNA